MDSQSFTFPKGEYFFGDLSFVIKDPPEGDEFFYGEYAEGEWDYKDKDYLLFKTGSNGDFLNHRGNEDKEKIPVESESFGLIPTDVLDPDALEKAIEESGFIFTSNYEVKIDVQADGDTYGVHIYPKREKYYFGDEAIFVVINQDEIDESYFVSKCPKFADDDKGKKLFILRDKYAFAINDGEHTDQLETFNSFEEAMKFYEEQEKEAEKDPEKYFGQSRSDWTDDFYPHIELREIDEEGIYVDDIESWSPDLEEEEEDDEEEEEE